MAYLLKDCKKLLSVYDRFKDLPENTYFAYSAAGGLGAEYLALNGAGYHLETDPQHYQFNNESRSPGCIFQFTLRGEGGFGENETGRTHVLTPGMGFLAPFPSPTRYWLPTGSTWEFVYFIFTGQAAYSFVDELNERYGYVYTLASDSLAVDQMAAIFGELARGSSRDDLVIASAVYRFLVELQRPARALPTRVPDGIKLALEKVELSYAESDLSIESLATVAQMSRYHFTRRFKASLGMTPVQYLTRVRLRHAVGLLADENLSVKEIAFRVGFNDYPYFVNVFRRHVGSPPGELRRHYIGYDTSALFT
jgi:AraC-like DNA-binding protein